MQHRQTILVFARYPEPGKVKTRLAATIGPERAAALYRGWLGEVLTALQPLRGTTRVVCCYEGATREMFRDWEQFADDWQPQSPGGLGERLTAAFTWGLAGGSPVLAVGTDCLEIDAALVGQAFDLLASRDLVFGPATDGGYYLVGMAADRCDVFASVRWSCSETLADHLARCRERGWSYGLLPFRHDIDTEEDWQAYLQRTGKSPWVR